MSAEDRARSSWGAAASRIFICRTSRSVATYCNPCSNVPRKRYATALCDGPAPANMRRATCDLPLCGEHRTRVGPNRDLCPSCARVAAAAGEATIATEPDDVVDGDDRAPTLFDVVTDPQIKRIR